MFIRKIKRGKNVYYYIAKNVREGNKVHQKSILYIGTADALYDKLKNLNKN